MHELLKTGFGVEGGVGALAPLHHWECPSAFESALPPPCNN